MEKRTFAIFAFVPIIIATLLVSGCISSPQAAGQEKSPAQQAPAPTANLQASISAPVQATGSATRVNEDSRILKLPEPRFDSDTSVEEALRNRRSVRRFSTDAIDITDVSQLLWSAQGITSTDGQRTSPSAQRLYPLEVYVIALNVSGLAGGAYHYTPQGHLLEIISQGDMRSRIPSSAPAAFVIAVDLEKRPAPRPAGNATPPIRPVIPTGNTTPSNASLPGSGPFPGGAAGPKEASAETIRSWYYAETGHAAQNMYLQSESLGLGMVTQAGFDSEMVRSILDLPANLTPYYFIPVGHIT